MCGLFGWSGKDPKKFNLDKFNILGVINEDRGTHSCGVSVDGEILVGVEELKVFRDFSANKKIALPLAHSTVLGHTRHATVGVHDVRNAHPFGFGSTQDKKYQMIGAHNGSLLSDYPDIATKRKIKKDYSFLNDKNQIITRDKIDSEILLEALYVDKDFSVLSEYNGAAALTWYYSDEPNVLYLFHGASAEDPNDKNIWIERPLFVYKESKNSLYYSSIKTSLEVIGGTDETIVNVPHNTVFKITNGDFDKAETFQVDRSKNVHKDLYNKNTYTYWTGGGYSTYGTSSKKEKVGSREVTCKDEDCGTTITTYDNSSDFKAGSIDVITNVITYCKTQSKKHNETSIYHMKSVDTAKMGGKIYEHMLRYWRNGHPVTGVCTYIKGHGFHYLSKSIGQPLSNSIDNILGAKFVDGVFLTTTKKENNPKAIFNKIEDVPLYYFLKGVRLRHIIDFKVLSSEDVNFKDLMLYDNVSKCSAHPIIDLTRYRGVKHQSIKWHNVMYNGTISLLGSDNCYTITNGNLQKVVKSKIYDNQSEAEYYELLDNTSFKDVADEIIDSEADKAVEHELDSILLQPLAQMPAQISILKAKFPENARVEEASTIIDDFVIGCSTFLGIEVEDVYN